MFLFFFFIYNHFLFVYVGSLYLVSVYEPAAASSAML